MVPSWAFARVVPHYIYTVNSEIISRQSLTLKREREDIKIASGFFCMLPIQHYHKTRTTQCVRFQHQPAGLKTPAA